MLDVENPMVVEHGKKHKCIYAYCDECGEPIYEDEEVTSVGEGEIGIYCHSDHFDSFISGNKETYIAKERM